MSGKKSCVPSGIEHVRVPYLLQRHQPRTIHNHVALRHSFARLHQAEGSRTSESRVPIATTQPLIVDGFGLGKRPAYWHYKRETASNDRYEAFRIIFHDLLLDLPVMK
jgi:hypothetical protein